MLRKNGDVATLNESLSCNVKKVMQERSNHHINRRTNVVSLASRVLAQDVFMAVIGLVLEVLPRWRSD